MNVEFCIETDDFNANVQGETAQHKTPIMRQTRKPIWQEGNVFKLEVYGASEGASKAVSWAMMLIRVVRRKS